MASILAKRSGEWFLAAFAPHVRGFTLSTAIEPQTDRERFYRWRDREWVWSDAPLEGTVFYPKLLVDGVRVYAERWHPEIRDVLLCCMPTTVRTPGEPRDLWSRRKAELLRAGWTDEGWAGLGGYVHVNDLEKLVGPPPTDGLHPL